MRPSATGRSWILACALIAAGCTSPRTISVEAPAPAATPPAVEAPSVPEWRSTFASLLELYDKNHDGRIGRWEYGRSDQAFRNLDRDGDGSITAKDLEQPVEMPPDLAAPFLIVRRFAGPDADSIAIGDLDEAFEAVDADHDGAIDRAEFVGPA